MVNRKKKSEMKIDIREIFLGLQNQMRSKLSLNRRIISHPVAKGDATELEWIDMLGGYLPIRYRVDKAFVIDCNGNISDQIDIVIYDRHYSPFLLKQNGATYIPAESVYAIIEVKPSLNMINLKYAAKKAYSVRKLKRTSAPIVQAGGDIEKPKKPFDIIAGVLTIDGSCSLSMKEYMEKLTSGKFLNFGCSLDTEAFWFKKNDKGRILFKKSKRVDALIFFFLNLLSELQRLGTVPAIDIEQYGKSVFKSR